MMKKDSRILSILTLRTVIFTPWYWLSNLFGTGLIIGYQKAINLFQARGTLENNMYLLEALSVFTMFIIYLLYVYSISQNVKEEQKSKMNAGIYYRYSSNEFLRTKVTGYMLAAMVQLFLFSVALALSAQLMNNNVNIIDYKRIILVVTAMMLGLMMYLFLFAALASRDGKNDEVSQLTYPGLMLLVSAFLVPLGLLKCSNQSNIKVLMFIPFLSPCIAIACIFRKVTLTTSYLEFLFFIILMVLQAVVITRICVKAYEKGIKSE